MLNRFALRVFLKLQWILRRAAIADPLVVASSQGFDGVRRFLEDLEGPEACELLRKLGATVGERVRILRGMAIINADADFSHLRIGDQCHIGRQVLVDLAAPVEIGNRVTITMRSTLITHTQVGDSRVDVPCGYQGVRIGNDVYIGAGATILPGVELGDGAIVASGAVVTRSFPAGARIGGVPAKALPSAVTDSHMRTTSA